MAGLTPTQRDAAIGLMEGTRQLALDGFMEAKLQPDDDSRRNVLASTSKKIEDFLVDGLGAHFPGDGILVKDDEVRKAGTSNNLLTIKAIERGDDFIAGLNGWATMVGYYDTAYNKSTFGLIVYPVTGAVRCSWENIPQESPCTQREGEQTGAPGGIVQTGRKKPLVILGALHAQTRPAMKAVDWIVSSGCSYTVGPSILDGYERYVAGKVDGYMGPNQYLCEYAPVTKLIAAQRSALSVCSRSQNLGQSFRVCFGNEIYHDFFSAKASRRNEEAEDDSLEER